MIEVYGVDISEKVTGSEWNLLLGCVSEERRKKAGRFYHFEDAERTVIGEILIRWLYRNKVGHCMPACGYLLGKYGKPSLADNKYSFNVSHTGDYVIACLADSQVGIDVEKNKRIDLDIGKQYFAKDEYNSILLQPPELRSKRLLEFWTLKESYLKYLGYGLVMELSSFCVSYDGDKASLTSGEKKADFGKLNFANKNYVGFVCTEEGKIQENVQVKMISIHELIKDINSNLEDKKQR